MANSSNMEADLSNANRCNAFTNFTEVFHSNMRFWRRVREMDAGIELGRHSGRAEGCSGGVIVCSVEVFILERYKKASTES
jgi:hypothetical protein